MQNNFRERPNPLRVFPLVGPTPSSWVISSPAYVLKTPRAETIAADVRAIVREMAPEAPMYRVYTMAGLASDSMVDVSFTMLTLGVASALALILGVVGLYGILSYVVAERTPGDRRAPGARRPGRAGAAHGRRPGQRAWSPSACVIGIAAALGVTRALGSLLFGVAAVDAATFAGMSAAMIAIGLLASYLPARRASKIDPMVLLRPE